ncbi:HNH endonuclease [Streptomyces sp. NPDC059743]|uniref:HNH endonuclease n=1 Tax=Streptomyces sp. NPDC059743 TaxID=3346928 RepID=UPI0036527580
MLGISRDLDVNSRRIKVSHQARLVMGMIRRFCYTTDRQIMARHLELVNGLDDRAQEFVARALLPFAHRAWQDICSERGKLRFEHDHYMKLWAMTEPALLADFVLLDEAQDTNPVLEEVFLAQEVQRICVGDPAQRSYGWCSAQDVMTGFPADHLHLTQSFRFGPAIAAVANRWLTTPSKRPPGMTVCQFSLSFMPQGRPAITQPMQRQVLVEADHRCAIPTCRATPVELAHIRPYAQVLEHTFENLIALCPTCHTRFDRGDMDRKSMRQYKANLGLLSGRYGPLELQALQWFADDTSRQEIDIPAESTGHSAT